MRKFPKLKYPSHEEAQGVLGDEVVVTEKLDGANFRFEVTDDAIKMGTRNVEFNGLEDPNIPKAFHHARDWLADLSGEQVEMLRGRGTFFGEAMHYHSLKYEDVEYVNPESGPPYFGDAPNVVLFDWYESSGADLDSVSSRRSKRGSSESGDSDRDEPHESAYSGWAHWDSFERLTEQLDLPTARVIDRGPGERLKEVGALDIPEESMFGGPPEGIVVRQVDGSIRAKKVSEDFKEKNAQAFDDPNKSASAAGKFVAGLVTQPRIEKAANKLVDEGDYDRLQMDMMSDLPRKVLVDAVHEEAWDTLLNGGFEAEWDDDFKADVRSKASKKCARVLKQMCQEF